MSITYRSTAEGIAAVGDGNSGTLIPVAQNIANDIALLLIAQESPDDTVSVTGDCWVRLATWAQGTSARFWLYARRNPQSAVNPIVRRADKSGRFWAYVREFAGCTTVGNAWEVVGTSVSAAAFAGDPLTVPGVTTLTMNTMIVALAAAATGNYNGITGTTATDPTVFTTEYHEYLVTGGAISVLRNNAVKASAGATGNIVINLPTSPDNVIGGIAIALTEDDRVPTHEFDAKVLLGGLTSNPTTGILSVGTGCTALALGVVTRASTGRTGGLPTVDGNNMTLASDAQASTAHTEMYYMTGSFFSTLSFSVPNTGGFTVWGVATSYKAQSGRTSRFDTTAKTTASGGLNMSVTLTLTSYGGAAVVAMIGASDVWSAATRSGTLLYEGAAYGAQYTLPDIGGDTEINWAVADSILDGGASAQTIGEDTWVNNTWVSPTGALTQGESGWAYITESTFDANDRSYVLKIYGFDFSAIPNTAVIDGVTCRVYGRNVTGTGAVQLDLLQLLDATRARVGTNQCATPVVFNTIIDSLQTTKGGATDLWGNALTPAWVKDADFGVALGVQATENNADVSIDYVTLEVHYHDEEPWSMVAMAFKHGAAKTQTLNEVAGVADSPFKMFEYIRRVIAETSSIYEDTIMQRFLIKLIAETLSLASVILDGMIMRRFISSIMSLSETTEHMNVLRRVLNSLMRIAEDVTSKKVRLAIVYDVLNLIDQIKMYAIKAQNGGLGVVLADTGAKELMKIYYNNDAPVGGRNLTLRLYVNDYVPEDISVANNFTEAAGAGYSAKTLLNGYWTIALVSGLAEATYAEQVFEFTGALTNNSIIYGYYVTDEAGTLIFAERSEFAFQPSALGDHLDVNPKFRLSKGSPS